MVLYVYVAMPALVKLLWRSSDRYFTTRSPSTCLDQAMKETISHDEVAAMALLTSTTARALTGHVRIPGVCTIMSRSDRGLCLQNFRR